MKSTTTEKLIRLEAILKEKKSPVLTYFNDGLLRSEIEAFFISHNIPIHPDLICLYEWHNGVKSVYGHRGGVTELLPFGTFFNLEEMLLMKDVFKEFELEDDFGDLDNYLPILGTGESDMFLLNLSSGEILSFQPMIQIYGDLAFRSIDKMIDCITECLKSGAFTIDEKDGLEVNFDKYGEIQKKFLQ